MTQGDFLAIVCSIWPNWSSRVDRTGSFRKVGITPSGLSAETISKRSFNFAIPDKFLPKVAPSFSQSPEGVRKGSAEYLQFKLKRAYANVAYLEKKPMLPSEKGIFADQCTPTPPCS